MDTTSILLHTDFTIGPVDPRIFGGFLEHMGRAVYEGVFDPGCKHADNNGFRSDVLEALQKLHMTLIRYPGGNFASGYHWMNGIGPIKDRPVLRDLAWQSIETNQFGTDDYIKLCKLMDWTPMLSVNLGTGTAEEAGNWVEYCNCPGGTRYADMRIANGIKDPYNVKLWCLGNEMDGNWQLGHVPADQYAIRAQQAAKIMRDTDKNIELVACGSSNPYMSTYLEWDRKVLEHLGDHADYISVHRYAGNWANDTADYLTFGMSMDRQIEEVDAVCRFVQAKKRSKKRAYLCIDEWNVMYKPTQLTGMGDRAPHIQEEIYNLEDALIVAQFLNSFIRHADVVKIANLAQIVNVIAPLQTRGDDLLIQSIFHPLRMVADRRNGTALRVSINGPVYESKSFSAAQLVDASAIVDNNHLHVFLVNRSQTDNAPVSITCANRQCVEIESAECVAGNDPKACNSFDKPDVIVAQKFDTLSIKNGSVELSLPPLSFVAATIELL